MADKELDTKTNDEQQTYSIISCSGSQIPFNYFGLVISKWLRTYRTGCDYMLLIKPQAYYEVYDKVVKVILNRPNTKVRLAILSDEPDIALGFCVYEGLAVHYIYVHSYQRNKGIAKSLLPKDFKYVTHLTKTGLSIWNKYPEIEFNPFI